MRALKPGFEVPRSMISVADILNRDGFLTRTKQFDAIVGDEAKRIFSITKTPITLNNKECWLLLLEEQTTLFLLEQEREAVAEIKFASSMISN